eukprot:gene62790-85874_t
MASATADYIGKDTTKQKVVKIKDLSQGVEFIRKGMGDSPTGGPQTGPGQSEKAASAPDVRALESVLCRSAIIGCHPRRERHWAGAWTSARTALAVVKWKVGRVKWKVAVVRLKVAVVRWEVARVRREVDGVRAKVETVRGALTGVRTKVARVRREVDGKGSVAAMLDAIFNAAGLRRGLYTSPHLVRLGERVQVD